jgi:hypothetical protein
MPLPKCQSIENIYLLDLNNSVGGGIPFPVLEIYGSKHRKTIDTLAAAISKIFRMKTLYYSEATKQLVLLGFGR